MGANTERARSESENTDGANTSSEHTEEPEIRVPAFIHLWLRENAECIRSMKKEYEKKHDSKTCV
jgi:hypothetical protein